MNIISKVKILYYLFRLSRDVNNYRYIEKFRSVLKEAGFIKRAVERIKTNPQSAALIENRHLIVEGEIDFEKLEKYSPDTLGFHYAKFIKENKLQLVFFDLKENKVVDEETYYIRRVLQTHDIWHVLLGYSTSVREEIILQAFMLSQIHWPTAPFTIGGAIFSTLFKKPHEINSFIAAISEGWRRAEVARPLFPVRWENLFGANLQELRKEYGLEPKVLQTRALLEL